MRNWFRLMVIALAFFLPYPKRWTLNYIIHKYLSLCQWQIDNSSNAFYMRFLREVDQFVSELKSYINEL